jgi:DNA-binding transcriptional ArsR family regulator
VPIPHPIPDELLGLIAHRFRLLAEPTRLRLLDRLREGEATVQELADDLETSQQNVSKHLAMLAEAGVLARRPHGTRVYYRIGDAEVLDLCERMCDSVEHELRGLSTLLDDLAARPAALNPQPME